MAQRFPVRCCPVCGCNRSKTLFRQRFERLSRVWLLDGYDVVICEQCGAGFADDIPLQSAFDAYYRELSKYDYGDQDGEQPPEGDRRFEEIAGSIEPFLEDKSARILEIGCGSGQLLHVLRRRGFRNGFGVDPSPGCIRTAKALYGVEGAAGTVETLPEPDAPYDFIILIGVMEHIRELDRAVARLRSLVSEDGRIYLEVPDASRYVPRVDAPFQEFSIEHINFFSGVSLANLMQLRGFRAIGSGSAVRLQHEVTCPTAFVTLEKTSDQTVISNRPAIERDGETEAGLRMYIEGCEAEDVRIRGVIEQALLPGERMIVWGVGTHTLRLLATNGLDPARVALFVDSNPKYQRQELRGVPVVSPESLQSRPEPILISSRGFQHEIQVQIREKWKLPNPLILLYEAAS